MVCLECGGPQKNVLRNRAQFSNFKYDFRRETWSHLENYFSSRSRMWDTWKKPESLGQYCWVHLSLYTPLFKKSNSRALLLRFLTNIFLWFQPICTVTKAFCCYLLRKLLLKSSSIFMKTLAIMMLLFNLVSLAV